MDLASGGINKRIFKRRKEEVNWDFTVNNNNQKIGEKEAKRIPQGWFWKSDFQFADRLNLHRRTAVASQQLTK